MFGMKKSDHGTDKGNMFGDSGFVLLFPDKLGHGILTMMISKCSCGEVLLLVKQKGFWERTSIPTFDGGCQ